MSAEGRLPWLPWLARGITALVVCWACAALILIRLLGDRWWIGTIAMFSPRWMILLPIPISFLFLPGLTWRVRVAVLASMLAASWGILGFCVPWSGWLSQPETTYRLLTCNVAAWSGGTELLEKLILDSHADVVLLQEYAETSDFRLPDAWSSHQEGELLIASRYPIANPSVVERDLPGRWPRPVSLMVDILTPERTFQCSTLHLLSPKLGLSSIVDSTTVLAPSRRGVLIEETRKRDSESRRVALGINKHREDIIVAGDFNMPVESFLFRRDWGDFSDAFSGVGFGIGITCFVEQGGIRFGSRIDHILTRGHWRAHRCWVGPDIGSDHRPLLADIYWE